MEIQATNDFSAPPAEVFAMLTDPAFLAAVCLATSPIEHEVVVDGLRTATRRVVATPAAAQALAGETMTILDQITWHTDEGLPRGGETLVQVAGFPVDVVGTVELAATAEGSRLHYRGVLSVRVPLLGPALAKQAAPALLEALAVQERVGAEYLAGGR